MSMTDSNSLVDEITRRANNLAQSPTQAGTPAPVIPAGTGVQTTATINGSTNASGSAELAQLLASMNLSGLLGWALNELKTGATTDQIQLDLRQTPQWKAEYGATILARQQAGLPPINEAQVQEQRNTTIQLFNQYGVASNFYTKADIDKFIADDKSTTEIEDRLKTTSNDLLYAPPEVKAAFQLYTGTNNDQQLFHFLLDPDKATPYIDQMVQAAQLGGTAVKYGIGLSAKDAMSLAQAGVTLSTAETGYQDVNRLAALFQTNVGEAGSPNAQLDKAQGVEARMLGNAQEMDQEQQKLGARAASTQGKVGVEENPEKGFEGLGVGF